MRTDRTQLCTRCALRMSRRERACPQCQGTLHDLTRASDRSSALRLLAGVPFATRTRRWLSRVRNAGALRSALGIVVPTVLTAGFAVANFLAQPVVASLVVLACAGILFGTWLASTSRKERAFLPGKGPQHVRLLPEKPPDGPVVIRGRVRVDAPTTSPVGGVPCAAWRITGRARTGAFDDAALVPFEVEDEAGPVRVEGIALVVVEPVEKLG